MPAYFLVKSEPGTYSYEDLVREGRTSWDGIRNFAARNHLRAMKVGDLALFYHSTVGLAVVGVARVVGEARPDPTAKAPATSPQASSPASNADWSSVELAPVCPFVRPVTLAEIKADPALGELLLVKQGRLSAMPVSGEHFKRILALGKTKLPKG